jgi:hypothetical protein
MPASRGALGPCERGACHARTEAPHRDPRDQELVNGPGRGWEGRGVERGEPTLGLVEAPEEDEASGLEQPRVRRVPPVAACLERRARRVERLRGPAQVTRGERDLGLGDDAPRAGHGLSRAERTRRTSHERPRTREIAQLRHRDAAQRERGRVVAQGDPLQRGERIARGERAGRRRDQ